MTMMFSAIILLTRFCNILQKQIQLFCLLFQSSSKEGFLTKRGAIVKVMRSIFNICEFLQNVLQYIICTTWCRDLSSTLSLRSVLAVRLGIHYLFISDTLATLRFLWITQVPLLKSSFNERLVLL